MWCKSCDYAANVEAARRPQPAAHRGPGRSMRPPTEHVHTPDLARHRRRRRPSRRRTGGVAEVHRVRLDGALGLALGAGRPRGQRVRAQPGRRAAHRVRLFTDDDFAAQPDLPKGYLGPDFDGATLVVADPSVGAPHPWVTGANETDHHVRQRRARPRLHVDLWADLVTRRDRRPVPALRRARCRSTAGSRSVTCSSSARSTPRRSTPRTPTKRGAQHPMVMGCYGIGVSRIVAAVVEEHHDEQGIAWPRRSRRTTSTSSRCPAGATPRSRSCVAADALYAELRDAVCRCSTTTATRARA